MHWTTVRLARLWTACLVLALLLPCAAAPLPLGIHKHPKPALYTKSMTQLPRYDPASTQGWQVDVRCIDLSRMDLSQRLDDLLFADFDTRTTWPATLPAGFDPEKVMQLGKSPGLGVRRLHEQGINGKGVGVAIIDQALLVDHDEYADRMRHYEEIHWPGDRASMHGPAVASIAVGKTVGVAPGAELYFIAERHGDYNPATREFAWDFTLLAKSIDRMLEINKTLPKENKIRVISISVGWRPEQKGYAETNAAVERAKKQGIFVVSSSLAATFGMHFHGLGRAPMSDPDLLSSYLPGSWWAKGFYENPQSALRENTLLVPMDSRCTASPAGPRDYAFYRQGGWSWAIPYLAGLYAVACQAKPDVTPELFWKTALETGAVVQIPKDGKTFSLGKVVQPEALIKKLAARPSR